MGRVEFNADLFNYNCSTNRVDIVSRAASDEQNQLANSVWEIQELPPEHKKPNWIKEPDDLQERLAAIKQSRMAQLQDKTHASNELATDTPSINQASENPPEIEKDEENQKTQEEITLKEQKKAEEASFIKEAAALLKSQNNNLSVEDRLELTEFAIDAETNATWGKPYTDKEGRIIKEGVTANGNKIKVIDNDKNGDGLPMKNVTITTDDGTELPITYCTDNAKHEQTATFYSNEEQTSDGLTRSSSAGISYNITTGAVTRTSSTNSTINAEGLINSESLFQTYKPDGSEGISAIEERFADGTVKEYVGSYDSEGNFFYSEQNTYTPPAQNHETPQNNNNVQIPYNNEDIVEEIPFIDETLFENTNIEEPYYIAQPFSTNTVNSANNIYKRDED